LPRTFSKFARMLADFSLVTVDEDFLVTRDPGKHTVFELSGNPWGAMTVCVESGFAMRYYYSDYSFEKSRKVPYDGVRVEEVFKSTKFGDRHCNNDIRSIATQLKYVKNKPSYSMVIVDVPLHRNTAMALFFRTLKEDEAKERDYEILDEMPLGKESALQDHIMYLSDIESLVCEGGSYLFKISEILTARNVESLHSFLSFYSSVTIYVSEYSAFFSKEIYFYARGKNARPSGIKVDKLVTMTAVVQNFLYARLLKRYDIYLKDYSSRFFHMRVVSCRFRLYVRVAIGTDKHGLRKEPWSLEGREHFIDNRIRFLLRNNVLRKRVIYQF